MQQENFFFALTHVRTRLATSFARRFSVEKTRFAEKIPRGKSCREKNFRAIIFVDTRCGEREIFSRASAEQSFHRAFRAGKSSFHRCVFASRRARFAREVESA